MKLQNLTVIFVIVIIPVILLVSLYITNGLKTIKYQAIYDSGLLTATHDAIYAFELNTTNDAYSDNAETKRNILKSSVKAFERSLCNTCGISSYNTKEIEEYIPAIMFGMYDGFYMYAPSLKSNGTYEHSLKNYVYYSEEINGIIIRYSLDSYITVSGDFEDGYETKEGYLMVLDGSGATGDKYKNIAIHSDDNDDSAIKYYQEAYKFTTWFNDKVLAKIDANYFKIDTNNDPEDENSAFTKHKREVMKNKIEQVLNSTITAYSNRTTNTTVYKMPKLNVYDWEKIYSNISMVTFFQGKNIGLTNYNGYCVLNSTNSNEYVNPNLMYFINGGTYHDIRCTDMEGISNSSNGYRIGAFQKTKTETTNNDGETTYSYIYKHDENACYNCINGQISSNASVYDYVRDSETSDIVKSSYFTSLARERYNTVKLLETEKDEETITKTFNIEWEGNNGDNSVKPDFFEIEISKKDASSNTENFIYDHTEAFESGLNTIDLKLRKNVNKVEITYKFEAKAGERWSGTIDGNTIKFTYRPQEVKYTVTIKFDDNSNIYNKRPTKINISASNGFSSYDDYSIKIDSDTTTTDITLYEMPSAPYEFLIKNKPYGYESSIVRIEKDVTITLKCNLKIAKWEMNGTQINGKDKNNNVLQTVKIGDYINYNFNEYTYTINKEGVKSSESNNTVNLKNGNWRIIGVEKEQLLIALDNNMPYIALLTTTNDDNAYGYDNGMIVFNDISEKYKDGTYATEARTINPSDIRRLLKYSGLENLDYENDENKQPPRKNFSTNELEKSIPTGVKSPNIISKKNYDLLFPESTYGKGYFINMNYDNGYYNTYSENDGSWSCLYASLLKQWSGYKWRGYLVRTVVYLKKEIILEPVKEDGFSTYNIK